MEEQIYGPTFEAAVKFFVHLDHTALLQQAQLLAVVGINPHLCTRTVCHVSHLDFFKGLHELLIILFHISM